MRRQQQLSFYEEDLDVHAFEFADLAARAVLDILKVPTGTPHLTERYQRITHEIFCAIRSTVDTFAAAPPPLPHHYGVRERRGVQHYNLLRRT
jgi:hypothetical protein